MPAPPLTEYQVKAAYLFNFGQFVEWPAAAYSSPAAPFVIGIVGEDPFGNVIDDIVRGESLAGRPLLVKRFKTAFTGAGSDAAIIALKTENNRIRMRINVEEARANNLVISSKLLRLAGP